MNRNNVQLIAFYIVFIIVSVFFNVLYIFDY